MINCVPERVYVLKSAAFCLARSVLARAVVDFTAAVVDTLPAPAEGVIKTTDTRTRRTTTATAIEGIDFEIYIIAS